MKKLLTAAILAALILSLSACKDKVNGNSTVENRFLQTNDSYVIGNGSYTVVVDKATEVVYLITDYQGGITVLYNSEGKPMTFKEYEKTKKLDY